MRLFDIPKMSNMWIFKTFQLPPRRD